ncbi:MAG: tRNA (N(6)-L-threonylcarbamoyladenosine(37)-C(2))-methylthiotransferase MtaB [Bacteroidales bacterium]|nr:tRNA (N(6)-L-threonylcarbamoyladenosine(37)-C(2))-methylthiotransferase MtaB [Bacteroidales bacterium]
MIPKKIAFKTLGCRLNLYVTDALASTFSRRGYEIVDPGEQPDVFVVNTCTVTNQGDQKSRQEINRMLKKEERPVVVVTGCMIDNYKKDLSRFAEADYLVDNKHKTSLLEIVDAHFKGETIDPGQLKPDVFSFEPAQKTFHTRSLIKIQDGCDNFCTYCIVPKVRGRAVSRPVEDIIENIRQVIDYGYKEIVLTGVNIGRYEYGETDFESLIEKILEIPGDFRVRISSIEPEGFGEKLFDLFAHPKLMPHLHLCLQSGSDKILMKMRRLYNISTFRKTIESIRNRYQHFNLTTDIIVGFPGETDEDFQQSVRLAEELNFSHIHTFKYSVRTGTRAARMEDQITEKIKNERSKVIREISLRNKTAFMQSLIGKPQQILVEKINAKGMARGYGELYVPLEVDAKGLKTNEFYPVIPATFKKGNNPVLKAEVR